MPLQAGSDDVLRRMRRGYRQERYLGIIDRVRAAMPDAAITTDIIVGFPGETEADFEQTLDVVRQARFASAFTFQYSKRPGTPAAEMDGQLPEGRRPGALPAADRAAGRDQLGGEPRADRLAGSSCSSPRGRAARTPPAAGSPAGPATAGWCTSRPPPGVRPGDVVETVVTEAAPHHLMADGALLSHRRTRAGDASEAGTRPTTPGVVLGMPRIGAPA